MNPNRTSQLIPTLLTEIIIEILFKLPVESLLRCKSVCKEWYSLISDHHFIKSHFTLSSTDNINYEHHRLIYNTYHQLTLGNSELRNNLNICPLSDLIFHKSDNNAMQLENPLQRTRTPRALSIVGSCNGLLCLLVKDENTLYIYNPSTTRTNVFPGSEHGADSWFISYGFGYDEMNRDYKVVKVWCCDRTSPYWGAMIYSLKAGSWKEISRFPWVNPYNDGKFLNGALHWASGDEFRYSWHIVSLDLRKETYGEVLQPEYDGKGHKILTLGVLGEWLCVLCNYCESRVVDVWVMKVYGVKDSWIKMACIPYPTDIDFWWNQILDPLCISNDGKVLLQFGLKFLVYDSKDSSSTMIDNFDGCRQACVVVESLEKGEFSRIFYIYGCI